MRLPLLLLTALLGAVSAVTLRRRRRARLPAKATIRSPRKSTEVSTRGAVRSVQSAEFTLSEAAVERLWTPENLENLARTYWRFLSRVTLGLIRVFYGSDERRVALLARPLTLLRFEAPEYAIEPGHGSVCWRIKDGILVARSGRGCGNLKIDVWREPMGPAAEGDGDAAGERMSKLYVEIEVSNFYPSIASNLSRPVYMATQSWVHVAVTHGFLRSLARLDLAESRIGTLKDAVMGAVTARERITTAAAGARSHG